MCFARLSVCGVLLCEQEYDLVCALTFLARLRFIVMSYLLGDILSAVDISIELPILTNAHILEQLYLPVSSTTENNVSLWERGST